VSQSSSPPTVYLDLWALMDIGKDEASRHRLARVLISRGGTLMLSWVHMLEFVKASASAVEQLLVDLELHYAFLNAEPGAVIAEEDRLLVLPPSEWTHGPHMDFEVLKEFVAHSRSAVAFEPREFLGQLQSPTFAPLLQGFRGALTALDETLQKQRARFRDDPSFARQVRSIPTGPRLQTPTRYVLDEACRGLIRDTRFEMKLNDWADFCHMVVAVSYCDYVVLDKGWAARARQVEKRLTESGVIGPGVHFAKVFSSLEAFWVAIEAEDGA
jgi:hypothetical protein